jgi:hypothetical protein
MNSDEIRSVILRFLGRIAILYIALNALFLVLRIIQIIKPDVFAGDVSKFVHGLDQNPNPLGFALGMIIGAGFYWFIRRIQRNSN